MSPAIPRPPDPGAPFRPTEPIIPSPMPTPYPIAPPPPPPARARGVYVGVIHDELNVGPARAFMRFKVNDLPSTLVSARLDLYHVDKALPTVGASLYEVDDFVALDGSEWDNPATLIEADVLTPSTLTGAWVSVDVTTEYNAAKSQGLTYFAVMLQYDDEGENVDIGRWYLIGATAEFAPQLVIIVSAGQDAKFQLLTTPITVNLAHTDGLGNVAAVITAGDASGAIDYPPLGESVRLAATIDGITDDASGTYTSVPGRVLGLTSTAGVEFIHFLLRSPDLGCGMTADMLNLESFTESKSRLLNWFRLVGGLTQVQDVRDWIAAIGASCRTIAYVDHDGLEALATEPVGGSGLFVTRTVGPHEHGPLRAYPLPTWPISRLEILYGMDRLGLSSWDGHALIASGECQPADPVRDAQATDALARYGLRELNGTAGAISYEWVPKDRPGQNTGITLIRWLWDQAFRRPLPYQVIEAQFPRFALGWALMDEIQMDSHSFPSAAARVWPTTEGILGVIDPAPDTYQCRRVRCSVRELPRVIPEAGSDYPVSVVLAIVAWETA